MADGTQTEASGFVLMGGAALIAFALIATAFATRTGVGVTRLGQVTVAESKDLTMVETSDGGVIVTDLGAPARTWLVRPSTGDGFVQVVVQGLMHIRQATGVDASQPYRLVRQPDGRLWLEDLSNGKRLTLDAFGPVSAHAFAKFLDDEKALQ